MGPGDVKVEDTTGEGSEIKKSVLEKSSKMTNVKIFILKRAKIDRLLF